MRRLAILVAISVACSASWAAAAPPVSNRLKQYGASADALRSRQGYATQADYRDTRPTNYGQARRVDYQEARPTYYQESVPPGSVSEGPVDDNGPGDNGQGDNWQGAAPWDDGYGFDDDYGGGCCDNSCCATGCAPGFWGRAEYLYWWVRGAEATPPLVTTSPPGTSQTDAGVLPNATTLFGGDNVNTTGRSGGRFTLGYWFNNCSQMGVDATFLFLGAVTQEYFNNSNGDPILARPFFNTQTGEQDANLIAFPGIVTGRVDVLATSRVNGGDVNLRRVMYADCWTRFEVLAGYRYFSLAEGLNINTNTTSIDPQSPVPVGTTFSIFDSFSTRNNFNGGQLGLNAQMINGCWTVDLLAKLAIGSTTQHVAINGGTTVTVPEVAPVNNTGGILALGSNIGSYQRSMFSVLPEFSGNLRYQMTPLWRLNLGYTLMLLTNVARPGDQIDTNLDPNQFPPSLGGSQPTFTFHDTSLWLQGINFGIECNF